MPYALCPMPYALCPMPYAHEYLIFLRKAIVMPQVDRTMQILSGGYLDRIRAAKIRLGY